MPALRNVCAHEADESGTQQWIASSQNATSFGPRRQNPQSEATSGMFGSNGNGLLNLAISPGGMLIVGRYWFEFGKCIYPRPGPKRTWPTSASGRDTAERTDNNNSFQFLPPELKETIFFCSVRIVCVIKVGRRARTKLLLRAAAVQRWESVPDAVRRRSRRFVDSRVDRNLYCGGLWGRLRLDVILKQIRGIIPIPIILSGCF